MKKVFLLIVWVGLTVPVFGQLTFNNTLTPMQLLQNYLLGPSVTVTNVSVTGAPISMSAFTCGGTCNIGFPSGILMSTGEATGAGGPAGLFKSTDVNPSGSFGDPQLDAIVAPLLTHDATIIEFDFSVASDSVKFEYVFASEEYNEYVNTSFNDVFGFFISGPGIVGQQNIALIPNTSTTVSINNVNNGNSGGAASGPCTNCAYYRDNVSGPTYFDGMTTVLTAKSAVMPCETYHIKLAIADVGDGVFDSGVFLKAGSFSPLGSVTMLVNNVPYPSGAVANVCTGTPVELCLNPAPNYTWNTWETTQCIDVDEQNLVNGGAYGATINVGTCFSYTEVQVNFVTPTASITASGPTALCPGSNVTLTANPGTSYLWSNGQTTQSIIVGNAGTYTVTVSAGPGCSAVSTPVSVTVGSPVAQITGVLSLCSGANTTLTANAGQSYLWNTGATTQTLPVTTAGSYTVTVTQAGGCTASATANVQVNANPVPVISGDLSICQGQNTAISVPPGFASYLWNTSAATPSLTVSSSGTYTVTVTDANGCTGITSAAVVVSPLPVPVISGVTSFCTGSNTNISVPPGFASYAWNTSAVTPGITVTTGGTYTVTVTNAAGCSASTNVAVTANPLPVPNITGDFSICQGTSTAIATAIPYASYQWSTGAVTPTINVSSGNTITVTVTDANGCTNTDSQLITVNPNPVPVITGDLSICQGENTSIGVGPGYSSQVWSHGPLTPSVTLNTAGAYSVIVTDINGCTGTTSANLVVNALPVPAIAGITTFCQGANSNLNAGGGFSSYLWSNGLATQIINVTTGGNYAVTVTNPQGCSATTSTLVTVNALPNPNISGPTAVCVGNSATLNAGGGFATYLWNNGLTTQSISATTAGTYTVTVTSAAGCVGTDNSVLVVNPLPTPSITGVTTICQGATTILTPGPGYSSYSWSTGATGVNLTTGTAGPVTVTVTDANGCSAPASANVTVNPLPTPVIMGVTAFCQGGNSTLDAGAGYSSYVWNTGAVSRSINVTAGGSYTVTVTAATGCAGADNELVTVHPNPAPVISGGTGICVGTSTTLNAGGGYATYLWNNGATTQTIPVTTGGNYTVTVSSAFGCQGSAVTATVVNPLPTPVIAGVTSICQGTTTSFTAGTTYSAYQWSNGSTAATITPGTAGIYTLTVTDANGCKNSDDISLVVNANPVPSITGVTAFCQGDDSNINAGPGYSAYEWSTGATTQVINVSTAGNYIVTVTDNNGCEGTTNTQITVNPNPSPAINGGTGICQGLSTNLVVPGTYASYLWSTGDATPTITVNTAGTYSVTVTTAFGCSGTNSTSMVINPLPTPVIAGVTSICQGSSTSFTPGPGYNAYQWSNGSTAATITPGLAGIYTVTVTDANGCKNTDDINLVVNANPVPAITGDMEFCIGDNSNIAATPGYTSYSWSTGATTPVINVTTAGNYAVTVTDNNGCIGTIASLVVVNPLPNPVITGATAICQGNTTSFTTGNYASYIWSNGQNTQSISAGNAGNYAVTVTDNNGCVNTTSTTLTVYALPSASITGTTDICFGQSTTLDFTFTGTAPFAYSYSNGQVTIPGQPVTGNTATITVAPGTSTTYTLVSVADAHCAGNIAGAAQITVNPLPQPVITGDMAICDGETTTLSATPGFANYTWSNSASQPNISTGIAGIYTVSVIDNNGCQGNSPAVNLIVNAVPVVQFTNDTSLTCAVPEINFTNLSVFDPGSTFSWNFGDGTVSDISSPSHLFFAPGTYPISLEITTPAGCVAQATNPVEIMFYPLPEADFVTSNGTTNVFNGKVSFVDRSSNAVSWFWEFGDGAYSFEQNPVHYFNEVGDYKVTLRVTNIAGCDDRYEDPVTVNPFYIPNAFSPNADGVNDVFYYSGYDLDVQTYSMNIFNRWGELVFSGENENDNWNGMTREGNEAPQGTYIYKLQVTTRAGKEYVFNGHVNLIR